MSGFRRDSQGRAVLAGAPVAELLSAAGVATPAYVYDLDGIAAEVRALTGALGAGRHLLAYAVKANSAGSIVRTVARAGGGADVVSGGELELALGCGIPPDQIVMSGVAKTDAELDRAIGAGIRAIQVESVEEIARVGARARAAGRRARVSLRINPGVAIESHAHVATGHDEAKFGIPVGDLNAAWASLDASETMSAVGVSTHVGSMLHDPGPYIESARAVCRVARARQSAHGGLDFVDFGGGFGISYGGSDVEAPAAFAHAALRLLEEERLGGLGLVVEPGRSMVGPHGVLVARVLQGKLGRGRRWAFIDAAMNDLLRPALYGAPHRIEPLNEPPTGAPWRVAGPVCESADDFGDHALSDPLPEAVVIRDAGAYGFVMASEYNGRPLAAEIFAAEGRVQSASPGPGLAQWVKRRLSA